MADSGPYVSYWVSSESFLVILDGEVEWRDELEHATRFATKKAAYDTGFISSMDVVVTLEEAAIIQALEAL